MRRKIPVNDQGGHEEQSSSAGPAAEVDISPEAQEAMASGDGVQETDGVIAEESASPEEVEALRAEVERLQKEVEQERNQYLRTLADFQNFRRRQDEQRGEVAQFANRELILSLLPVLDNFERALAASEQNKSYEALVGGVALTLRQLQEFLKRNGVEPIDAVGKDFDPNFHEAVMREEDSDKPENTVVEEMQRGYTMHSRVLRPSMVKVARG
jgi:molecular chaperone GrpE